MTISDLNPMGIKQNKILFIVSLKIDYFPIWFVNISDFRISPSETSRYKREQGVAIDLDGKNEKIAANQYKCDKTMTMCAKNKKQKKYKDIIMCQWQQNKMSYAR